MTAPSFEDNKIIGSLTAGADVTAFRFATVNASDDVQHTSAGGRVDGVSYLAADADAPVSLAVDGLVVLEAGGTIADGDSLISAANGRAVVSTDMNSYAVALEDATVGAHFRALFMPKNTVSSGIEVITATPGALSLAKEVSIVKPDGTDAHTLASGLYDGQKKFVKTGGGTNTPITVVTGAFNLNGTTGNTLTLENTEYAALAWSATDSVWHILHTTAALTTV
jgi:hypothetical protein